MKIKFNWGTGIVIAIVIMMSGMLSLVYFATRQDYYLVDDNYYQKGLDYQEQIGRISNTNNLDEKPLISISEDILEIIFPAFFTGQTIEGQIHIYSPVNEAYDMKIDISTDNTLKQVINISNLNKGRYTVKIDWTANDTEYYMEQNITTNQ